MTNPNHPSVDQSAHVIQNTENKNEHSKDENQNPAKVRKTP